MTLRTPRRRISPRTKRRVHAIRNFLKRALGSSSQGDIKINSSIAVNVTDLKHKLAGFEQHIGEGNCNEHNKFCPYHGQAVTETNSASTIESKESKETTSSRELARTKTTVLYRSETNCDSSTKCSDEDFKPKFSEILKEDEEDVKHCNDEQKKIKYKKRHMSSIHHKRDRRAMQSTSQHLPTKYDHHDNRNILHKHRSNPGRMRHRTQKDYLQDPDLNGEYQFDEKVHKRKSHYPKRPTYLRKNKTNQGNVDQDFIADIIQRQYKPTKYFGQESDISQFSVPVCRDHPIRQNMPQSEIYSYYVDRKGVCKYRKNSLCDLRSVCDTRLYSNNRRTKHRHSRPVDVYNDARHYDLIPVKEKSSPNNHAKSKRKLEGGNYADCAYYKEVPPSPRTHRPQLNLHSHYYDQYEDYGIKIKHKRLHPKKNEITTEQTTDVSTCECVPCKKHGSRKKINPEESPKLVKNEEVCTSSSLHSPMGPNEVSSIGNNENVISNDTSVSLDKTDRTLNEIKDILQSFLQEIKKESFATQVSGNSLGKETMVSENTKNNATSNSTSIPTSFNNMTPQCSVAPPFIAPFTNPCCYPVFPMCPMNCMQNGYVMPTPSCTACPCGAKVQEEQCQTNSNIYTATSEKTNDDTDELIKQIHKFVSENPKTLGKLNPQKGGNKEKAKLTSRSVGSHASKQDAQVGTTNTKYYSRSCEALGSRYMSDTYYTTNNSYSDTVLERLSLETGNTVSDESETESSGEEKSKSRLTKVLQTLGLKKRKKKKQKNGPDEEESDSEALTEVHRKHSSPYKQNIQNYAVYGQEYFNRPPYPQHQGRPPEAQYIYGDPRKANYAPPVYDDYNRKTRHDTIYEENLEPTAPPYPGQVAYEHHQHYEQGPQIPYCFKEVELKSTATQSDRKISFFKKLSQMKPPSTLSQHTTPTTTESNASGQRTFCTQTGASAVTAAGGEEKIGFWKSLVLKAERDLAQQDVKFYSNPLSYGLKNNKMMAEGNVGTKSTLMKKMFTSKNPFNPRNVIVNSMLNQHNNFRAGQQSFNAKPKMWF